MEVQPKFLPSSGRTSFRGHAIDHAEIMGDDVERYAEEAQARDRARLEARGSRLDAVPMPRRLVLVEIIAKNRRASVKNDLRLIRHLIDSGREKHAVRHLERLEGLLRLRAPS